MPYPLLDLHARRLPDFFQHRASGADDDGFLRIAFHVNRRADVGQVGAAVFPLFDGDRDRVWDFLPSSLQDLLADQLRGDRLEILVGDLVRGV